MMYMAPSSRWERVFSADTLDEIISQACSVVQEEIKKEYNHYLEFYSPKTIKMLTEPKIYSVKIDGERVTIHSGFSYREYYFYHPDQYRRKKASITLTLIKIA